VPADHSILEPHSAFHDSTRPHVIVSGHGVRVTDEDGVTFLDAMAGLWCATLGFSEPRLTVAAASQLDRLPFYGSFNHRTHDVAIELAARLARLSPMPGTRVFFANSGSEANDSALKLAWLVQAARGEPERRVILAHERGYHGSTALMASVTGLARLHAGFGEVAPGLIHRLRCPDATSEALPGESPEAFADRLIGELEAAIRRIGPDRIAAMITEPVLGAGGLVYPPPGYHRRVGEVLRRHGILLVSDEVITAFGRTGVMLASPEFEMAPDMITCAKGLSAAFQPISAVLVGGHLAADLARSSATHGMVSHGFTYSAHPVAAAVAVEVLRILEADRVLDNVRRVGAHLHRRLRHRLATAPGVAEIRGQAMLAGVRLAPLGADGEAGRAVVARAREHGLLVRAMGDVVVLAPALILTAAEADEAVDRLAAAVGDVFAPGPLHGSSAIQLSTHERSR
jgi:4-aminobutyrate--pyruvate transaminase